jgi:hypothetical protein
MSAGDAAELIELACTGAGGREAWDAADECAVRLWAGGSAFAAKLQRKPVQGQVVRVATSGQRVVFEEVPAPGLTGIFEDGAVRIERADGSIEAERRDARAAFRSARHLVRWDHLDTLYFGGQAMWTYVSVPFVLTRPGFECEEIDPWSGDGGARRRLRVRFPAGVHTHCAEQVFYFDEQGRVRRHDYISEPFGRWAAAAHYSFDHERIGGLVMPTRRRVYPRLPNNRRLPFPLIVRLDLAAPEPA